MIKIENITVELNKKLVLREVSLELEKGELLLIVGPNGSGKSTLLKVIAGLIKPQNGRISIDGVNINNLKPCNRFKRGIVLAPEKMRIAKNLTVEENLRIAGKIDHNIFKIFPELRPLLNRKSKDLSGGERQMVVLARALLSHPKYLLLDEPFQALHFDVKMRLINSIKKIKKDCGIALVTHDEIDEVLPITEKVCILVGGEIAYYGCAENSKEVMKRFMFL